MANRLAAGLTVSLVGAALCVVAAHGLLERPQSVERRHILHVDGGRATPESLEKLAEQSDLVLHALVTGQRPADRVIDLPPPETDAVLTRTAYQLQPLELFKGSTLAFPVELVLPGGRRDRGGHVDVYEIEGFPPFKPGEHYLLFLRRRPDGSLMLTTATAESVFLLAGQVVRPRGMSGLASAVGGHDREKLFDLLRRSSWR